MARLPGRPTLGYRDHSGRDRTTEGDSPLVVAMESAARAALTTDRTTSALAREGERDAALPSYAVVLGRAPARTEPAGARPLHRAFDRGRGAARDEHGFTDGPGQLGHSDSYCDDRCGHGYRDARGNRDAGGHGDA